MAEDLNVFKETFISSLPLIAIFAIVTIFIAPFYDNFDYVRLAVGYMGVVIGQSLFLIGLNKSVLPIGKDIGASLNKIKKITIVVFFGTMFGFFATIAEPAMWVLAKQTNMIVDEVNIVIFVVVMGIGIGVFVGLSLYRIIKNISIRVIFASFYMLIFLGVAFVPPEFIALAFDGSGATTGDISVPFVLALGMGVATTMSKSTLKSDDSFGLIGIASIGPIISIFIYGIILSIIHDGNISVTDYDPRNFTEGTLSILLGSISDTLIALVPLLATFLPFQKLLIKMPKKDFNKIMLGVVPVFLGLLIFLFSIDFGFAFTGSYIGETFMSLDRPYWFRYLLLVVGFILGAAITLTEPAVTMLSTQLEIMLGIKGIITRITLALGIGFSCVFAIIKIMYQINILWFLIPLYAIAIIMMIYTPRLFVGLAFDSGGVAGGALSSAVLTPLTLGIAQAIANSDAYDTQNILINGFGIIAFLSITPVITIECLGILYSKKTIK